MNRHMRARRQLRRRLNAIALLALVAAAIAGWLTLRQPPPSRGPEILVFAEADTASSARWIACLTANGFRVRVRYDPYVKLMHRYLRVPEKLRSLHTALVDGYIIEGNVPATDIRRLLIERPHARGLAVPGLPDRAPGAQHLGGQPGPYQVLLFDDRGAIGVFATH